MRLCAIVLITAGPLAAQSLVSPEVHADRTVTFRVKAPGAQKVELALEGAKPAAMAKADDGVWSITTAPLAPEIYGYTFNIDGTGFQDPSNGEATPNSIWPSSSLLVPATPPMAWEQTAVPHGIVHHHFYESKLVGDRRDYFVYTPPNWDPKKSYPLLVLLHGYSDYANGWTAVGKAHLIFDNLIAQGITKPLIVVMPLGYGMPMEKIRSMLTSGDEAWLENAKKFSEALLTEVLPLAEKQYKISSNREQRAITGLSMGGGESLQVGLLHLNSFSRVGAFSAGIPEATPDSLYPELSAKDNARLKLLWIACGKDDDLFGPNHKFVEWLKSKDIHYTWTESAGGHTWLNWRDYLIEFARRLEF